MDDSTEMGPKLLQRWQQFSSDVEALLRSPSYPLAEADLPKVSGVYVIVDDLVRIADLERLLIWLLQTRYNRG